MIFLSLKIRNWLRAVKSGLSDEIPEELYHAVAVMLLGLLDERT